MMKKLRLLFVLLWVTSNLFSSPVTGLLERIDKGASSKFIIERQKSGTDFF
jgi:alpha-N-acetylglucosaminidase